MNAANGKKILGRASLSFPAVDGILDVDQILETEPWSQIDKFVQYNFVQNVLNAFNKRVTLDPKFTPADNKSPGKKRTTSSSVTARKRQSGQTDEEKSAKKEKSTLQADGGSIAVDRKKETAKEAREEQGKKGASTNRGRKPGTDDGKGEEKKSKAVTRNSKSRCVGEKPKVGVNEAKKPSTVSQKLKAGPVSVCEENKTADSSRRTEIDSWPLRNEKSTMLIDDKAANAERNRSTMSVNTTIGANSKSPLRTSTPKRGTSFSRGCVATKPVAAKNVSTSRKDSSTKSNASATKACTPSTCAKRNVYNDYEEFVAKGNGGRRIYAKCECKPANTGKVKIERKLGNNETSRTLINESTKSRCKSYDKTSTDKRMIVPFEGRLRAASFRCSAERFQGGKRIGEFEGRLIELQEKREKRKIERHERKAERAMEKFSHHVTRIAREMGYLPDQKLSIVAEDADSSDSCCSRSSCSCCTSSSSLCTSHSSSGYAEYTLNSSFG